MKRFLVRRLLFYLPVMLLVTIIVFSLVFLLPGDPAVMLLGEEADPKLLELYRKELGLDRPIPVQYAAWLGGVFTGDWGRSLRTQEKILVELRNRLPVTLQLGLLGFALSLLIAIPIGMFTASRPNTVGDTAGTLFAIGGVAIPDFWAAVMLIYLFAVILGWLPAGGYVGFFDDPVQNMKTMALPVFVLGFEQSAGVMRQTRSSMLDVLRQDYIRTAHAKGLGESVVLVRHALKNAFIPVLTILGLRVAIMLGRTAIIETIFGLPGVGRFAVTGVTQLDLPVVQGVLLLSGTVVILANLATDILYGFLDPRIRYT
ncbi:MAG: ABC transporter permease [Chloroflexi bacterium]|nr:ABC transporter permease [Chloroflexota bacterium]